MSIRRLLIAGWDCADPSLIDSLCDRGRLPNLSALRKSGMCIPLGSTIPPSSLPAWTSAFTGVGPGRHGLTEYVRKDPGAYRLRLVTSRDRNVETLFSLAKKAGLQVACLGVPGTYPPDSQAARKNRRRIKSILKLKKKLR